MKKIVIFCLIGLFFFTRLYQLTLLPIFADEAIYIRWATMIFHDPQQFLFLPLYDGKSPLFIWLLIPMIKLFAYNPLWGARALSALFGALSLVAARKITRHYGGGETAVLAAGILTIFVPFSLFHDRMGLLDTAVTAMLSWSFYFYSRWRTLRNFKEIIYSSLIWGLGLMIKTTAFYFLPVFVGIFAVDILKKPKLLQTKVLFQAGTGLVLGLLCLGWMRISPLFPFLFQRSSDFAFTPAEFLSQPMKILLLNISRISRWLWIYMTPSVWLALISAFLISTKNYRKSSILIAGLFLFLLPFILTGKLLASRYILPSLVFIIPAASISFEQLFIQKRLIALFLAGVFIFFSASFSLPLYTNPGKIPFPREDIGQYLSDWSAGFGIPEARDFFTKRVQAGKRILIGTEGSFGTLPDGIFVYFSETPLLASMEIIGIGQPVFETPKELLQKSENYDETYLLVNQNRLKYQADLDFDLIMTYQKPHEGPPLLLLKLKP